MSHRPTIEKIIPLLMEVAEDLRCYSQQNPDRTTNALAANLENWALQRCIVRVRMETPDIEDADLLVRAHDLMRDLAASTIPNTFEIE